MRQILCLVMAALLAIAPAWSANHYVVQGGTGLETGNDWGNATPEVPSSLERGGTYYVAGATGNYHYTLFTQPTSGSTYIYFRKATASDHGTDTGWLPKYGTNVATWANAGPCWDIRTSYLDFNGVTGFLTNGYGIKLIVNPGIGQLTGAVTIYGGNDAGFISFHHVEAQGLGINTKDQPDQSQLSEGFAFNGNQSTSHDYLWDQCYVHDCYTWMGLPYSANFMIDRCFFDRFGSSGTWHSAGIAWSGNNMTIRYSHLQNALGHSAVCYLKPEVAANGVYVYGNIYRATDPNEYTTQWANLCTTGSSSVNYSDNEYFYNNTSYGLHTPGVSAFNSGNGISPKTSVVRNNLWVNYVNFEGFNNVSQADHNSPGDMSFSSSFVDAANGDFHLTSNTASGATLGSPFNLDMDGNNRLAGLWTIGALQYLGTSPAYGTIYLDQSAASQSEGSTPARVTVHRGIGTSGTVGISYATSNGSASAGVNYTSTSGTLTWTNGESADKFISIPVIDTSMTGSKDFTVSISSPTGGATLGSPDTETITLNGTGTVTCNTITNWTCNASAGTITAPFAVSGSDISQSVSFLDGVGSGQACYVFSVTNAAPFNVKMVFSGDDESSNSCYVDFDEQPQDPFSIFDARPVGVGFTTNLVSWRGTGNTDSVQFPIKTWQLSAGTHTLYIVGREANFTMRSIQLVPVVTNTVYSVSSVSAPSGWYKAGSVIPITVTTTTNATVTGTPKLSLNNGKQASYASGSGSTNLVFNYTVGSGDDVDPLDYASTSALALNGGTINDPGGHAITLTLPAPGSNGSLSTFHLGVDTIAPTIDISSPSVVIVTNGTLQVTYTVTYSDDHFGNSTLTAADVVMNRTGSANGNLTVPFQPSNARSVIIDTITGTGTLGISINAGTAADQAGNLAPAAGPSEAFGARLVLVITTIKAGMIIPP